MTYTFKLSSRLATLWAPVCAVAIAAAGCTDGDMSSMSPFDQLGNGAAAAPSPSAVSPKVAVVEAQKSLRFNSKSSTTWSTSGGTISSDGTFSSSVTGSFLVVGRGKDRVDSSRVTVVRPNQPRLVAISPREVQLAVGQNVQFTSSVTLPNGTATTLDLVWDANGGTIDKAGNYIAGSVPGSFKVILSAPSAGVADTAVVTVTSLTRHIVKMVLAPAAAVVIADSAQQYTATAQYDDGSVGPAMVSFGVSGGGSIDNRGRFTAGNTPGTFQVKATAQDGSGTVSTPVSVTTLTTSTTPTVAEPTNGTVLFSDDFSSGNLSKTTNGWAWSGAYVDVVSGFSKDGAVGHSARFNFKAATSLTDHAWSELRFKVGTTNLSDLWVRYWLYYPSGQEGSSRGPRFVHRGANLGSTNNKFFRVFNTYQPGYLELGVDTWADGGGDGSMVGEAKTAGIPSGEILWNTRVPAEIDAYRGRWVKIELHAKAASAPGSADGVLEVYRDGLRILNRANLDIYPSLGQNFFKEGYLLGWANSGFDSTTYAYISSVAFSTARLP